MKHFIIALGLMLSSATAFAGTTALKVTLANGTDETFLLSEKPVITCSGTDMIIRTSSLTASYPRTDITSMTFARNAHTDIRKVTDNITYAYCDNVFTCNGQNISVYNLQGVCVASGSESVSLQDLPAGIYLINVNNKTIKIFR